MLVSYCASEYVCLFVWLLPCSGHYICQMTFLLLSVLILWYNRYFHQSSPIIFCFIFSSIHCGRIPDIEFEQHGVPLPVRCIGKSFKESINYFVLSVLQRVTFCFCLFFKLSLVTTTGVGVWIMMARGQGM